MSGSGDARIGLQLGQATRRNDFALAILAPQKDGGAVGTAP